MSIFNKGQGAGTIACHKTGNQEKTGLPVNSFFQTAAWLHQTDLVSKIRHRRRFFCLPPFVNHFFSHKMYNFFGEHTILVVRF